MFLLFIFLVYRPDNRNKANVCTESGYCIGSAKVKIQADSQETSGTLTSSIKIKFFKQICHTFIASNKVCRGLVYIFWHLLLNSKLKKRIVNGIQRLFTTMAKSTFYVCLHLLPPSCCFMVEIFSLIARLAAVHLLRIKLSAFSSFCSKANLAASSKLLKPSRDPSVELCWQKHVCFDQ